jgi:hypothetical protein
MSTSSQPPQAGLLGAVIDVLARRRDHVEIEIVSVVPQERGADVDVVDHAVGGGDARPAIGVLTSACSATQ